MAGKRTVGGTITISIGARQLSARGAFSVSGFFPKREGVVGLDGVHGHKEMPQQPTIEGEITTTNGFQLEEVQGVESETITVQFNNGTAYSLFEAWETAEGSVNGEEGSLSVKFEGMRGEQI